MDEVRRHKTLGQRQDFIIYDPTKSMSINILVMLPSPPRPTIGGGQIDATNPLNFHCYQGTLTLNNSLE